MTPLRTMLYGGLGALIVLGVVGVGLAVAGVGWWGMGQFRSTTSSSVAASGFARYTTDDVLRHFADHMMVTTPTGAVPPDRLANVPRVTTPMPRFPRDNRSIDLGEGSTIKPWYVDILAFDKEEDLLAMWGPLLERQQFLLSSRARYTISIARHENIILVRQEASSVYETLLYTMR